MMAPLKFSASDRLLVVAPHPDDETLSSGVLIQSALAAGSAVRIVFATDGDNNPWPQRWLERRWHIGDTERARWGERRRREAGAALAQLGIASMDSVRFLGWPDQGLTDCLMRDDAAVSVLGEEIARFQPTHVVVPSLADRHPDHSALRVLLDLALLRTRAECVRLGYVVHGQEDGDGAPGVTPASTPQFQQRKRAAMESHASQIALSSRRLLAWAARPEVFEVKTAAPVVPNGAAYVRVPHVARWSPHRHELLLVLATATATLRFRLPLRAPSDQAQAGAANGLAVRREPHALTLALPDLPAPLAAVYAKVDRVGPRLLIFDKECWHEAGEVLPVSLAPLKAQTATSPG